MAPRLLPPSATATARRLVVARALRGFADGLVSVLLVAYLAGLGFSPFQVGAVVTATLVGSAALTLGVGLGFRRIPARSVLLGAAVLMAATGLAFATLDGFWPILAVAAVGTLNPSAGDVSVFLPTEQSVLAGTVPDPERPQLYAAYNLAGALAGAVGALASGLPSTLRRELGWSVLGASRLGFALYGAVAVAVGAVYVTTRDLGPDGTPAGGGSNPNPRAGARGGPARRRTRPRRIVLELAALFSLDSAGSGFVVQSLLVLWLHVRFDLDATTTATAFFAFGVLGAASQLACGPLARRIGLVRTMAYTHLPANVLLVGAAFAPTAPVAIALLLARSLLSQMDVPARQAFVMAVVPPEERAAAASITNVPRSLASAATPLAAGYLLGRTSFGWPLVIAGTVKVVYDLVLLRLYRSVPAEVAATTPS